MQDSATVQAASNSVTASAKVFYEGVVTVKGLWPVRSADLNSCGSSLLETMYDEKIRCMLIVLIH